LFKELNLKFGRKDSQNFEVFETFDGGVVDARQLVEVELPEEEK
jgi:hypothetical protein